MARPQKNIDPKMVEQLCSNGATLEDLAQHFGCTTRTIIRARQRNPNIQRAMDRGRGNLCVSLRQAQLKSALSGNVPMLIWLGKQFLGQSDKRKTDKTNIPKNDLMEAALAELRAMPIEDIKQLSIACLPIPANSSVIEG